MAPGRRAGMIISLKNRFLFQHGFRLAKPTLRRLSFVVDTGMIDTGKLESGL